jgi:hypothetical protein
MNKSDDIKELAMALSKTQAILKGALKDSSNPFFKSTYADLASVWEACREPLAANGLSVVQTPCNDTPDNIALETILMHSSGQWISSVFSMPVSKHDAQAVGSAITYARRYALAAMVGIAPEDDDGNKASGKSETPKAAYSKPVAVIKESVAVIKQPVAEIKETVAVIKEPVAMQGTGEWAIAVTPIPGGTMADWIEAAASSIRFSLEMCTNDIDCKTLYRSNKEIYDCIQQNDKACYDQLIAAMTAQKEKLLND